MMTNRRLLALFTLILLTGANSAVYSQELRSSGNAYVVDNLLPAPISVLIVGRDQQGNILAFMTMTLPARARQRPVNIQAPVVRIEAYEVIHLRAPRNSLPSFFSNDLPDVALEDPQIIKERLRELEISETDLGAEKIAVAAELAQLWLAQKNDEKDAFRNDPLRMEIQRQSLAMEKTPADFTRQMQKENERQRNELIEDVFNMAQAYAMVADAKLDVLREEKKLYEPYYKDAKNSLALLRQDKKNAEATVRAWDQFLTVTHQALSEVSIDAASAAEISILNGPRRAHNRSVGLKDVIEIEASAPADISVLLAESKFDRGGTQKTFFRRLKNSNRWVATICWPLSATSAQFRTLIPGQSRWNSLSGLAQAGRPSLEDTFQNSEKNLNLTIKKYKETSFRAEGADNIKTVPIP